MVDSSSKFVEVEIRYKRIVEDLDLGGGGVGGGDGGGARWFPGVGGQPGEILTVELIGFGPDRTLSAGQLYIDLRGEVSEN